VMNIRSVCKGVLAAAEYFYGFSALNGFMC
jgi:hypothetical protein